MPLGVPRCLIHVAQQFIYFPPYLSVNLIMDARVTSLSGSCGNVSNVNVIVCPVLFCQQCPTGSLLGNGLISLIYSAGLFYDYGGWMCCKSITNLDYYVPLIHTSTNTVRK